MKKLFLITAAFSVFTLQSFTGKKPHTDHYKVDTSASTLEWYAKKVSGKHDGTIKMVSGDILNNHGSYTGTFIIDMNTIANRDIESPEHKAKLEKHLKSPDFFDAAAFPQSKFVLKSVTIMAAPKEGLTHSISGLLTIKDKTNEITFDAAVRMEGTKIFSTGTAVVDRSKFDVKYGSKTFFEDIGDKMIDDEFTLKFSVVASK